MCERLQRPHFFVWMEKRSEGAAAAPQTQTRDTRMEQRTTAEPSSIEYRRAVEQDIDVLICALLAASGTSGTSTPTGGSFLVAPCCVASSAPQTLTPSVACLFLRRCILDRGGNFVVATNDTQIVAFAYGSDCHTCHTCHTCHNDRAAAVDRHPHTVVMAWANARHRAIGEQLVNSLRSEDAHVHV